MNSALTALLVCLLFFGAQGHPANRSSRCQCSGYMKNIGLMRNFRKEVPRIYYPSVFCPKTEIIIKVGQKNFCVDPESPFGKRILMNKPKNLTTTSASTAIPSSSTQAQLQTTSHL